LTALGRGERESPPSSHVLARKQGNWKRTLPSNWDNSSFNYIIAALSIGSDSLLNEEGEEESDGVAETLKI